MTGMVILIALLLAVGSAGIVVARVAARRRASIGPLGRQFTVAVAIALGQLVLAAVLAVGLMFVSDHDAVLTLLVVGVSGVLAVLAARVVARGVLRDIEAVRDGLEGVGAGRRDVKIATTGRDEVAQLAAAANAMIARLDAGERARRDLVAAVSHDLRTPITSLRLLAEALEDGVVGPEGHREELRRMNVHIRALGALIDDLFELSRLEAGEIQWSMEQVQLDELVGETVAAMSLDARTRHVMVRAEVPAGLVAAHANPEKVQRVLFNLIQNAIRHTPADGSIVVRAEHAPGVVEIEVADTGDGIPAGDRERIFDAFYRGGTQTARTDRGAGLGLAISRAIVEAHGGRIWLADGDGAGTRVRFSLPVAA